MNAHDIEAVRQIWAEDALERMPQGSFHGVEAIAGVLSGTIAALPDLQVEVITLVAEGADVLVRWNISGTHTGAHYQGIAPSGRRVAIDGVDHFTIRDGKVVSCFVVFDQMQFARQLKLLPADGSLPERMARGVFNARCRVAARLRR